MNGEVRKVGRRNFICAGLGLIALVTVNVVKKISPEVDTTLKFSEADMEKVDLLNSVLIDISRVYDSILNFYVANGDLERMLAEADADAERILAEASAVAEQRVREKFPVP
ncbi:MAG: hypothetical protein QXG36_01855 [Nitrososphaeria archaeon]